MARKRRLPKFSGKLAEPIYEPLSSGLLVMPDDEEKWRERVIKQLFAKLDLLLDFYGIDRTAPNAWRELCFDLGMDFVPGMRIEVSRPRKRGRRQTWKAGMGLELLLAVERTQKEHRTTISDAIGYLKRSDPGNWGSFTRQNLEARLREAKRARKKARLGIAGLLNADQPLSLARLAAEYQAQQTIAGGGLFGLGMAARPGQDSDSGEN